MGLGQEKLVHPSDTRHEYEVYEWEGEDEDPAFAKLTLGKLVAKFIVPTK